MRLILIRHPEPIGAAGVCYGRTDLPVRHQALTRAVEALRPMVAGPVVSSPLRRCTALAEALDSTYNSDPRLVELDFGDWEGRPWADIDRAEFDRWAAEYVNTAPPGGETWGAVQRRANDFLDEQRYGSQAARTVITHAGVIRAMVAISLGIDLEPTWRIAVPFATVCQIELGARPGQDRLTGLAAVG